MTVIYTSDLHGNKNLYLELFELAEQKAARAIIIGGDMLPFQGPVQDSLTEQKNFIFDFLAPQLEALLSKTPQATCYVMHAPPFETKLDVMDDGRCIGSRAIRVFIANKQPYLTLHGHIHESMEMSGAYADRIGRTICINPGQSTEELYAVVFDIKDVAGTIEHTVFGRQQQ